MAYLDPAQAFDHLGSRVLEGIRGQFPIKGKLQSLHLENLQIKDNLDVDDLRGQHKAKVSGESWSVPVMATMALKDNETGNVINRATVRVAEIPKTTSRYSYIVGGQEWQVDNQWQLKPGIYARRRESGDLESQVNVLGRRGFDLLFDPATKVFKMAYNKAELPLYPLLKTLGVTDDVLEKTWGKEIYVANKDARGSAGVLDRFYKSNRKTAPPSEEAAKEFFFSSMAESKLRPDSTMMTLGKPFSSVTGEALQLATAKMLKVQSGHPEDDRDSLLFKDLRAVGDFAFDKIRAAGSTIQAKAQRKINTAKDVRDIIRFDMFNGAVRDAFTKNAAARGASQINPVEMVSSSLQTTIMGPGGIKSERSISDEAKFVNNSHLGFLDPIHTPEGEKTGVTLRLPIGAQKIGSEVKIPLYDLQEKKTVLVTPLEFSSAKVVLPDQVRWEAGVPVPVGKTTRMSMEGGEIRDGKFSDARYVIRHPSQLFNMTANLIPFLGNTSGGRASMASRQIEQAISLVHREAPLVQVSTGVDTVHGNTFENLLGRQASHTARVDGKVISVKPGSIVIEDKDKTHHEVQLYDNYPLNDTKSVMHSTPLVAVGDTVKRGQTIADTNFTRKGVLALGTNLRVGYVPFKGYNFEDGVVISESAAKKLSSEHLQKSDITVDKETILDKKRFRLEHPGVYATAQYDKLDPSGIVRAGQRVSSGDPLVVATKPFNLKDRTGLKAIRASMSGSHTNKSLTWDSDFDGEVVGVHKNKDGISVHVKTIEPMQVGDKITGRYGNKGIVSRILPDQEMPHTKDGKPIEVALNPSGVPGRMNVGQVLETAVGKIAQKTGKPYIVKNFEPGVDFLSKVKADLKAHGLHDTEDLFDPVTKQPLGKALVGPQHMFKLVHQVEKKLSVRSGMNLSATGPQERYDLNLHPSRGGGSGGQSMGPLELYALLAHGAKANIREMHSYKSEGPDPQTNPSKAWPSDHNRIWAAIQTGTPLPPPKPSFAFEKFASMLRGAGINMEKKGHDFILTPLTDDQIKLLAKKELPHPADLLLAKNDKNGDPKPKPGGLFDENLTGGHGGRQWTRISLAEPLPNPVFERPIQNLTGLKAADYDAIIHGERGVGPDGHLVDAAVGVTGGEGIRILLDRIDVKRDLPKALSELKAAKGQKIDKALKRVKYLRALDTLGYTPSQAYMLHNLPVIPPVMRPVSALPDGSLHFADVNQLYSDFAKINDKLKDPVLQKNLTDVGKQNLRRDYYDGVRALMGIGSSPGGSEYEGLLHRIAGSQPKKGYFQNTLMHRRQDLTMRSTIVPEPALGLDEVGLPKDAALTLFTPFVVRKLRESGAIQNELQGPSLIAKKTPAVWRALDRVMEERPVILKRDPALHKYSVQAFRARPVEGTAIKIHPLVTTGFNADFDGDTMSAFVPITREAVAEAHKMFPSNNLFSEATGRVMYQPTLESALGVYKLSRVGKETDKKFSHPGEVIEAARKGALHINDVVRLGGQKTTAGRILLASALPEAMQKSTLHDLTTEFDKKGLDKLLTTLARDHQPEYGVAVNRLKDLGNSMTFGAVEVPRPTASANPLAFKTVDGAHVAVHDLSKSVFVPVGTHSLSLDDFTTDTASRNKALEEADRKAKAIYANTSISKGEQDRQAVVAYTHAATQMKNTHEEHEKKNPSNLFLMYKAGVKPGWDQYKQMVLAPMILQDSANKDIPTPVVKSYSEGLDIGGYWTQMHGARRGAVMKVQEVREPGTMSKLLMNNMMHMTVNQNDCGTTRGISLSVSEPDIHDRYLQQEFKHGSLIIPSGTLLSPDVVGKIRAVDKNATLVVRSPLKCEDEKGFCQKCIGLNATGRHFELGENVGIQSAHAIGERAIQLTLKAFHSGGVKAQSGANILNSFSRLQQLLALPQKIPNEASLAMSSGKIDSITKTPTGVDIVIQGQKHHVGKDVNGMPLHENLPNASSIEGYAPWSPPVVGMQVAAGQHLSDPNRTFINLHHLYAATGSIEKVQNHLTNEIHRLYESEGLKRRSIETLVKAMSNLSEVVDPGDHPTVLRGEYRPTSVLFKTNKDLIAEGKKPIDHKPVLKGYEQMPLELQEDWMAKLQHIHLRDTLLDAAATVGVSHIHGTHPVPAMAFGAELGLTSKDSLKPGYEHLRNVPAHHY